jgi:ATP-dependent DNA ligase
VESLNRQTVEAYCASSIRAGSPARNPLVGGSYSLSGYMNDLRPMLATLGQPPQRFSDFAVEAKFDGQRGIAVVDNGVVTLFSRNGANITRTFPEIASALPQAACGRPVVLDGEIVALDENGVPSFSRLQRRWPQNRRPSAELLRQVATRFYAFDVQQMDCRSPLNCTTLEGPATVRISNIALCAEGVT